MKMSTKEALIKVARLNAEMCMSDAIQNCLRACFTLIDDGMKPEDVYNAITAIDWQMEELDNVQRPED